MKGKVIVVVMATLTLFNTTLHAATSQDIDKVTTYSTLIGRAAACGVGITEPMRRVGKWMDRTFYGKEKSMQLVIFTTGVEYAASEQKAGRSPDSCLSVRRVIASVKWP